MEPSHVVKLRAELEAERGEKIRLESFLSIVKSKLDSAERRVVALTEGEQRERGRANESEVQVLKLTQALENQNTQHLRHLGKFREEVEVERQQLMNDLREANERLEACRTRSAMDVARIQELEATVTTADTKQQDSRSKRQALHNTNNGHPEAAPSSTETRQVRELNTALTQMTTRAQNLTLKLKASEAREQALQQELDHARTVPPQSRVHHHQRDVNVDEMEMLANECKQWKELFVKVADTPQGASRKFAELQRMDMVRQLELGEAQAKLVSLETRVGEYKFTVEKLESDMKKATDAQRTCETALQQERTRTAKLEGERDAAVAILSKYAVEAASGGDGFAQDRDMYLTDALNRTRAELTEAITKNENLTKQLKTMVDSQNSSTRILHIRPQARADAIPVSSSSVIPPHQLVMSTPLPSMKGGGSDSMQLQTVEQLEKKRERLKEMFQKQILLFKEAVYLLLGVKVDMTPDPLPQIRVRSMFAEAPEHALLFRMDPEKGSLELLQNDYTNTLDPGIFAYLTKCDSVPAFLATLTLDLFERQTFRGLGA